MKSILIASLALGGAFLGGCASNTRTIDNHPVPTDPAHGVEAYQAENGNLNSANGGDAAVAAGAGLVDVALGKGARAEDNMDGLIKGYCEIVGAEKTRAPCSLITLVLKTADGTVVSQSRTDADGTFLFHVKAKGRYELSPGSSQYVADFKPPMPIRAGAMVRMRLREKSN